MRARRHLPLLLLLCRGHEMSTDTATTDTSSAVREVAGQMVNRPALVTLKRRAVGTIQAFFAAVAIGTALAEVVL